MKYVYKLNPRDNEVELYHTIVSKDSLIKKCSYDEMIDFLVECINIQQIEIKTDKPKIKHIKSTFIDPKSLAIIGITEEDGERVELFNYKED